MLSSDMRSLRQIILQSATCLLLTVAGLFADEPSPHSLKDLYGDPLPPNVMQRLGTSRLRHSSSAYDFAFSPDSKLMASVGGDNQIRLWDVASQRQLNVAYLSVGMLQRVAFSPDGLLLAIASGNGSVLLLSAKDLSVIRRIDSSLIANTRLLQFTTTGENLVLGCRAGLFCWSVETGASLYTDMTNRVWDYSAANEMLAALQSRRVLWIQDRPWTNPGRKLEIPGSEFTAFRFSRNGKELTVARTSNADFTKRGRMIIESRSTEDLRPTHSFEVLSPAIHALAISSNDEFLAAGSTEPLRIWNIQRSSEISNRDARFPASNKMSFSADGRRFACVDVSHAIRMWSTDTWTECLRAPGSICRNLAWSGDARTLVAASVDGIWVWEVASGALQHLLSPPVTYDLKISRAAPLMVSTHWGSLKLWNFETGEGLWTRDWKSRTIPCAVFSPDGKSLAVAHQSKIEFLDLADQSVRTSIDLKQEIVALSMSPSGQLAAALRLASGEAEVRILDEALAAAGSFQVVGPSRLELSWSDDSNWLVCGGPRAFVYSLRQRRLETLSVPERYIGHVEFLPRSQSFVSVAGFGDAAMLCLWDAESQKALGEFKSTEMMALGLAISPLGDTVAISAKDGSVLIWRLSSCLK